MFTPNYHNDSWMREIEGKPAAAPAPLKKEAGGVKPLPTSPAALAAIVRKIAAQSGTIGWSDHVTERMELRGISRLDVIRVLKLGDIKGPVEVGANEGELKVKMAFKPKGRREIGVVTIVMRQGRLFLKTVEWEDK